MWVIFYLNVDFFNIQYNLHQCVVQSNRIAVNQDNCVVDILLIIN